MTVPDQRAELKRRQDAERARLDDLLGQADGFRRSQDIRHLVEAVRAAHSEPDTRLLAWIDGALGHADRLDPTRPSPPCVLGEPLPKEPRSWR